MNNILDILDGLRSLSGNAQIDYLRANQSPLLREVLEYTLDKDRTYKITELKFDKVGVPPLMLKKNNSLDLGLWNAFKKELDYLTTVKSAKDADVQAVKIFIESFPERERQFLKGILYKDLRINMDVKKCRTVWNDFLFSYPYMGCKSFSMKNLEKVKYPAYAQTKMDGTFGNVIVDLNTKTVLYMSRQSKPQQIKGCFLDTLFDNWIGDAHFTDKFVLTGEILVWDKESNKPLPRKISNGIIRREDKTQDELDRIHFTCWDFIPYDKFIEGKWEVPYKDRYLWLKTRLDGISEKFHIVNTWEVQNVEEAMAKFEEQYELGEEGVVIKSFNQIWQDGKPSGQVKIKAEKDCELRMIAFEEGKGTYAGMCGNIKCVSEDEKLLVYVKPRTPKDAQKLWDNQKEYLNRILTVKFNEVITSETNILPSLYLPVFVEIRDDKNTADTLEYIQSL